MVKICTLCIIYDDPRILLGMKKRGFGVGKWNGFGGKVKNETIEEAARRELREEAGIEALSMRKMGVLRIEFFGTEEAVEIHAFRVDKFSGEPQESEEMAPCWFHKDHIPYEEMWVEDQFWLRLLLWNKKFTGRFVLSADGGEIGEVDLKTVAEVE
jgi:8-oxo-dGTP diphosphatase/2-hydroxy-dATP diphosphatase